MTEHEDFEALAAGYALHALEPEDEQRLAAHLLTCASCARLVADTAALGAAFASFLDPEPVPPGLRERILAAAAAEPRVASPSRAVPAPATAIADRSSIGSPRREPPRRSPVRRMQLRGRFAVGALAAAIGIAVAVPVTLAAADRGPSGTTNSALAQWLLEPGAREVTLMGPAKASLAKAVMTDHGVFLVANGLPVNDRSRTTYVLWAANKAGSRLPVATFDVRNATPVQLTAAKLPYAMAEISQVAISYEPGRAAPPKPSDVVLSGAA